MRGHYEGVGMDRRTLHAMKVGSLASNIAYKADYKHDIVDYNYPATLTPSYQTTMKLVPLKDVSPLAMAPPASFLVTFLLWNGSQAARWNETG